MKKIIVILSLSILLLFGCSEKKNLSSESNSNKESSTSEKSVNNSSNSAKKETKIIKGLNVPGEIEQNNKVEYTLTATEVTDVTQESRNKTINDSNLLDFYSNGQAKQAVEIVLKMENLSGETLGLPYFDDVKVEDSEGVTNIGGWKNEGSSKTEFGSYQTEGISGELKPGLYEIESGETKLISSTVLLANDSNSVKFTVKSEKFNDEIIFELPITR